MPKFEITKINLPNKRRKLNNIDELADSISQVGLLNPITITEKGDLVAGWHRLEACKQLGWQTIDVTVLSLNEVDTELAEIDENLIRNELLVLERSEQLVRRKELYEVKYPQTKHGAIGNGRSRDAQSATLNFAKDTAKKTNKSARTISKDIQIAKRIPAELREKIRETPLADKKTELLTLTNFDAETQKEVVELIVEGQVETVEEGLKKITNKALPEGLKSGAEVAKKHKESDGTKWRESLYKTLTDINSIKKLGGMQKLSAKWSDKVKRQYVQECRNYARILLEFADEIEETL